MVGSRETDVAVIAFGREIRRIAVEKSYGAAILFNQLLKVLVLDHDLLKPPARLFYQRKIVPDTVRSTAKLSQPLA